MFVNFNFWGFRVAVHDMKCFVGKIWFLFYFEWQDRPDLIQSELAGLAFDSLQQVFRKGDIEIMFTAPPLPLVQDTMIWMVIDPAAGGPQSDYAIVTIARIKGCVVVCLIFNDFYISRSDPVLRLSWNYISFKARRHQLVCRNTFVHWKIRDNFKSQTNKKCRQFVGVFFITFVYVQFQIFVDVQ